MISWYRQVDNAKSSLEVVAISRDYFATWSPEELARLPEGCRPGRIRDEEDVEALHGKLVDEYRNTRASGDELSALQQITSFLVRASIRIAELRDGAPKAGSSAPPKGPMKSAAPREN
jgi:hypothetical protein